MLSNFPCLRFSAERKRKVMMLLLIIILTGTLLALTTAANPVDCLQGIVAATGQFIFNATDSYYNNYCHGELFLTSVYAAAKTFCTPEEIRAGSASVGKTCTDYGFTTLSPFEEFEPRLTASFIAELPIVNFEDVALSPMRNTSIIISESFYKTGVDTFVCIYLSCALWSWPANS